MTENSEQLQLFAAPGESASVRRSCVLCESGEWLHVHHIDGNHSNNVAANRVLLCARCHAELHRGDWAVLDREGLLRLADQVRLRRSQEASTDG